MNLALHLFDSHGFGKVLSAKHTSVPSAVNFKTHFAKPLYRFFFKGPADGQAVVVKLHFGFGKEVHIATIYDKLMVNEQGIFRQFVNDMGDALAPSLMADGIKVSSIPTLCGMLIFLLSRLTWLGAGPCGQKRGINRMNNGLV
jgi:hypothetical protein